MDRRLIIALAALLAFMVPTAALAQEEEGSAEEEPAVVVDDGGAAVPVPPAEDEAPEQPWTSRFLPPTLVLLTVLTIVGFGAYYVFAIRRKYEVVDA